MFPKRILSHMSKRENYCHTNLVVLRLDLSEAAQNLRDTCGSTEVLTTDRG